MSRIAITIGLVLARMAAGEVGGSESLESSLRATELEFAASVAKKNWDRFRDLISEDAVFVSDRVLSGRQAILEGWAPFFAEGGPSLEWRPEIAVVQPGGELGLTKGPYTLRLPQGDGTTQEHSGQFTSIWQRQQDGSWKIVFDSGCP